MAVSHVGEKISMDAVVVVRVCAFRFSVGVGRTISEVRDEE